MFTFLTALSVAVAMCALIAAWGGRHATAQVLFAPAFASDAVALALPGHRVLWASALLLACTAGLLVAASVTYRRNVRAIEAHRASCPDCGPDA